MRGCGGTIILIYGAREGEVGGAGEREKSVLMRNNFI